MVSLPGMIPQRRPICGLDRAKSRATFTRYYMEYSILVLACLCLRFSNLEPIGAQFCVV